MINLLPSSIREQRKYGRFNRIALMASSYILLLAFIAASIIAFSWMRLKNEKNHTENQIAENTAEIAKLDTARKQIDDTAKQLNNIKKLYDSEVKFSTIIPEIGSVIPPGAILTSLSLTGNKDEPLQLAFKTKTQELGPVIRANLVNSPLFQSADIISVSGGSEQTATTAGIINQYPYSISLVVSLKNTPANKTNAATGATK